MKKLQVSSISGKLYSQKIPLLVGKEVIVGKYNDKNLYQRIISGTKVSGTDIQIKIADDIDEIIDISGTMLVQVNGHKLKYSLNAYENSTVYIRTNVFDNKLQIISGSSQYSNGNFIATLLYTKTTD